eukprot:12884482-Prorocentrum_lima.AAC.1
MSRRPAAHMSQQVRTTSGCCWTCSHEERANNSEPRGFPTKKCRPCSNWHRANSPASCQGGANIIRLRCQASGA